MRIGFLIIMLIFSTKLFAWGNIAHDSIGLLVDKLLTPQAKNRIYYYLSDDIKDLETASDFPDIQRYDDPEGSFPWISCDSQMQNCVKDSFIWNERAKSFHYLNIKNKDILANGFQSIEAMRKFFITELMTENRKLNAFNETVSAIKILKESLLPEQDFYIPISWLVHLVGDLSQPLHLDNTYEGYSRIFYRLPNKHKVTHHFMWDTGIIQQAYANNRVKKMTKEIYSEYNLGKYDVNISNYQNYCMLELILDTSRLIAEASTLPNEDRVKEQIGQVKTLPAVTMSELNLYVKQEMPVIRQQLMKSVIVITNLLNEIFDPAHSNSKCLLEIDNLSNEK